MIFMSVAGIVAHSVAAAQIEVFESGVGSINLPIINGAADYRTTRSTHPHTLRLMSDLVSRVNESPTRFVLPFAHLTHKQICINTYPIIKKKIIPF